MKKFLIGLLVLPTIALASIDPTPRSYDFNDLLNPKNSWNKSNIVANAYAEMHEDAKQQAEEASQFKIPDEWVKHIKRPKYTSLNEELKQQYQENYQILKKCYVKPEDNLQDILMVMGKFINAYSDIVYGREIISYKQEIQDYDRVLSNTPLNKEANPEECLKARQFFEEQLI